MENKCNGTVPEYKAIREEMPYAKFTTEELKKLIWGTVDEVSAKQPERTIVLWTQDVKVLEEFDRLMKEEVSKM